MPQTKDMLVSAEIPAIEAKQLVVVIPNVLQGSNPRVPFPSAWQPHYFVIGQTPLDAGYVFK